MNPIALLSRFLFPPKCPFCGELLPLRAVRPCVKCLASLPRIEGGLHVSLPNIDPVYAPLYYEGLAREALVGLKFRRRFSAVGPLSELMAEAVGFGAGGTTPPLQADVVTWAPLSRKKLRERGFDQALLLANGVCKQLGWPKPVRLLKKTRQRAVQSSLTNDDERRANASGLYRVVKAGRVMGKRVLLVDDICTSGATLSECAGLLLAAGAVSVSAVVGARRRKS
jgi:predicted amidophosphoribosyltransferase